MSGLIAVEWRTIAPISGEGWKPVESSRVNSILSVNVVPFAEQDREALQQFVGDLVRDNPTVAARLFGRELILSGEDEERLEAVSERIRDRQIAEVGPVRVRYRGTIRQSAEAEGKYIRQAGGRGNYGHCKVRVEPSESAFEFVTEIKDGVVPDKFFAPIESGIREAAKGGILAGYEIDGFKATLISGSYHELDSNDTAFMIAASLAFKEAVRKAKPVLIEPIMSVRVTAPEEQTSRTMADISRRRGRILSVDDGERGRVISAFVPLAEALKSSPHGRPSYPMRFAGYEVTAPEDGYADPDSGVLAIKPRRPKSGSGSSTAEPIT
jgi:elongation factor G